MNRSPRYTFWLVVAIIMMSISPSRAELQIDITQGTVAPIPIAITKFVSYVSGSFFSSDDLGLDHQIPKVISEDLKNSGLFRLIDPKAFIQDAAAAAGSPRFADWRLLQTQALAVGKVYKESNGEYKVEFRLFDVIAEQQIEGLAFTAKGKDWRRIAHKISDAIYHRITGEKGYFDTRITFVAASGAGKSRKTRLAIMDQDGANLSYLTKGNKLVLTPRFSPTLQQITFMDYGADNKTPRVNVLNPKTKSIKILGNFTNMTFAPRYAPDGQSIIMSMSQQGNSSLYKISLNRNSYTRLTYGAVIDTSASYSPDGNQIVFNSDRGGSQQIYVMNADGSSIHRISYGNGRYATPVWSPRGDLIAFTKMYAGNFYIGVMRPDGSGERLLTQGYIVEEPTWAPNGRVLIYTREQRAPRGKRGKSGLYMIDLTGYNDRRVPTPVSENTYSASWSPLIP